MHIQLCKNVLRANSFVSFGRSTKFPPKLPNREREREAYAFNTTSHILVLQSCLGGDAAVVSLAVPATTRV